MYAKIKDHKLTYYLDNGHYIQEQEMGTLEYFFTVGILSTGSVLYDRVTGAGIHETRWFETNADQLGQEFLDDYMQY